MPIHFDYNKKENLSFTVKINNQEFTLPDGEWEKTEYKGLYSYTFSIYGNKMQLVQLITPDDLRNKGIASSILDIVDETVIEYNKIIDSKKYKELSKRSKITGTISICDCGTRLNEEQLLSFYRKHGYCKEDETYINKEYI